VRATSPGCGKYGGVYPVYIRRRVQAGIFVLDLFMMF
jgi:hypothetical protein